MTISVTIRLQLQTAAEQFSDKKEHLFRLTVVKLNSTDYRMDRALTRSTQRLVNQSDLKERRHPVKEAAKTT